MSERNEPTVVASFATQEEARQAIEDLKAAGFADNDIGYAVRDESPQGAGMATDAALTKDGIGAERGIVAGGLAGGILGALAALTIPGAGPVLAAGALSTALGFGAAGMATGGMLGAMMGLGVSEDEARRYENDFNAGRAIVTVHAGRRVDDAIAILRRDGGERVHTEDGDPASILNR